MHDLKYVEWRKDIEEKFSKMHVVPDSVELHLSPTGIYSLEIIEYADETSKWNYSRGLVRNVSSQKLIADIKRNYGFFWFSWVNCNGEEYLLCGEDYQGYNVINLAFESNISTFPIDAYDGLGFCWASVCPSPTGLILAVEGCYWACPNELVFFDFSNPNISPLPELFRVSDLNEVECWSSDSEFRFTTGEGENLHAGTWKYNYL